MNNSITDLLDLEGTDITISESFKFVSKNRRTTNATDMLIVLAYQNLDETSVSIAKRFHVSTHMFMRFLIVM